MRLLTALLLSSISQAEMLLPDPTNRFKYRYRLLATHYDRVLHPGEEQDIFTLRLYHVTYPHTHPGKGHGDHEVSADPYKTGQFQGREAFLAYLKGYDFNTEDGWQPVEDEPVEGAEEEQ